ncbi:MAG: hypothetical protein K2L89_08440, partial [Muribaculaceae bacterium]|nr:hypothetical protein [Muribaculaceae bacterium]
SPTGGSESETKKDFSVYIDMLKSNVTWRKAISASGSIPAGDIPVLLESFRLWIISIGEESSILTLADAKRRFSYWLKKHNPNGNVHTPLSSKNLRDRMRKEEESRKQKKEQERIEREKTDGYCLHRKYGYPFDIPISKVMNPEWREANPPESFR